MMRAGRTTTRLLALGALALAAVAVGYALLGRDSYTVRAQFTNAGGLVTGGRVEVAGRPVGTISKIRLTDDGFADVSLSIEDEDVIPLRVGTRAAIRAVGQAGVASNFVQLSPGTRSGAALSDNGVLPRAQASGIVAIDALLNSFGPRERDNLVALVDNLGDVYAGSGSRYFNEMLGRLDPALAELDPLLDDVALDRAALGQLVRTGSRAATAVASRQRDLRSAVTNSATALGAIARQRGALRDTIAQLPPVLRQARGTLVGTEQALTKLRPALRRVEPAAAPLRAVLRRVSATLSEAGPVAAQLRAQLPGLNRTLRGFRPLERPAIRALSALGAAMQDVRPIAEGLRLYAPDIVIGSLAALFGTAAASYDGYGHYVKSNFVQSAQSLVSGPIGNALTQRPLVPGLFALRTGLTRRCPGGAMPPAPDGSSPWDLGASLCTHEHDVPASVNTP